LNYLLGLIHTVKKTSLYSNAFFLMLNSFTTSLLGFIFWNIMARQFTPAQVGIGSALVAASTLLGTLANFGLGMGLVRFLPEEQKEAGLLVNAVFTITGSIAIILSLVYLVGIEYWSPILNFIFDEFWLSVFFILFTVSTALSIVTDQALVARRSANFVFGKNLSICLLKLPLPILVLAHLEGYGIFAATGIAILIGMILSWFAFLPRVYKGYFPRTVMAFNHLKEMLAFSFSNYLAGILQSGPGLIYPFLVLNFYGPEQSAYFYIAWMMAMVLGVIPMGLAQSLFAEGSREPEKVKYLARRSLGLGLILSLWGVGLMVLAGGWFLQLFGTDYYENSINLLWILAASVIPQCINTSFLAINQVYKRVYFIIAQSGVLASVALGLGYWLLRSKGLEGMAIAYLLAHLIVACLVIGPLWMTIKDNTCCKPETVREIDKYG